MARSFIYLLLEPGASLYPLEALLSYALPLVFYTLQGSWGDDIVALFHWNALCQFVLFVIMVQIPTYLTGKMSYVDMGWPCGLVVVGLNALAFGTAPLTRRLVVCIPMILHGARMAVGALFLFWVGKGGPYLKVFEKGDLSRYQYAKMRWCDHLGKDLGNKTWWMKQQHDTIMQAFANTVVLAGPLFLVVTNSTPVNELSVGGVPLEMVGAVMWLVCFALENTADLQMQAFVRKAKKNGDIRTAVLGYSDGYNTREFWLWTLCRHPNYFFEWSCWNAFVVMVSHESSSNSD
jgi:steroid 5-alpha reductase family enzyme